MAGCTAGRARSPVDAQPAAFFAEPPLEAIIDSLGRRLQTASGTLPLLPDPLRFSRKKLEQGVQPLAARPALLLPDDRFVLDLDPLSIHEHNYLDLPPLLQKLREHSNAPPYRRTAVLFLRAGILTLPHAVYRTTLQAFERPLSLANYRASLADLDAPATATAAGAVDHGRRAAPDCLPGTGILTRRITKF